MSAVDLSAVRVRLAQASDYPAVMAIHDNVYIGLDYLPELYHYFIQDHNTHLFVAEYNGKLVGFGGGMVLDGGATWLGFGGRVTPAVQNSGIQTQALSPYMTAFRDKHYPAVKKVIFLAVWGPAHEKLLTTQPEYKLVRKWTFLVFSTSGEQLQSGLKAHLQSHPHDPQTQPLGPAEAVRLLANPHTVKQAIKETHFIIHRFWRPVRVTTANLLLAVKSTSVVATRDSPDDRITALSFASTTQVPGGVAADINLHCHDSAQVCSHLLRQLEALVRVVPSGPVHILVYFPLEVDKAEVISFLQPGMATRRLDKYWESQAQVAIEKDESAQPNNSAKL